MNQRANESGLNREQFEQLKEAYITTIVESMSTKDLENYVYNDMEDFMNKLSESEVINDDVQNVKQWTKMPAISDELYAELVKEFNQDSYYFFN